MNMQEDVQLEIEEPLSVQIEQENSARKIGLCSRCRSIFDFHDAPNEKHHRPVFIIIMCILHVSIHLLIYSIARWHDGYVGRSLSNLGMVFVPCMRPTPDYTLNHTVSCGFESMNTICSYDAELRRVCFSFMYPYQLWRMITVNLLHANFLHLFFNTLAQCMHGIPLECKYGPIRIFVIYWLSNIGASLCFMIINPEKTGVGASGALYGLMLFMIVDRLVGMRKNPGRRLLILIQLTLLIFIPSLISQAVKYFFKIKVAHSAHFGGGLTGFLCSIYMLGCPWPWNYPHCISRTVCQRIVLVLLPLYFITITTIFILRDPPFVHWTSYLF